MRTRSLPPTKYIRHAESESTFDAAAEWTAPATAAGARFVEVTAFTEIVNVSTDAGEFGGTPTEADTGDIPVFAGTTVRIGLPLQILPGATNARPIISIKPYNLANPTFGSIVWIL